MTKQIKDHLTTLKMDFYQRFAKNQNRENRKRKNEIEVGKKRHFIECYD